MYKHVENICDRHYNDVTCMRHAEAGISEMKV